MTIKTKEKTLARALQQSTGKPYMECLRVVRERLEAERVMKKLTAFANEYGKPVEGE